MTQNQIEPSTRVPNKFDILEHTARTYVALGKFALPSYPSVGKIDVVINDYASPLVMDGQNSAVITAYNAPSCNIIYVGNPDDPDLLSLLSSIMPFVCFARENTENRFAAVCKEYNLTKGKPFYAHIYTSLQQFQYTPKDGIEFKKVTNAPELMIFDEISSTCFGEPQTFAFSILFPALGNNNFHPYVIYFNGKQAGCCMLSIVQGEAGLYWDGVLPFFRGQGVGEESVKHRMKVAKELGYKDIRSLNNENSVGYYQKLGFTPVGDAMFEYYTFGNNPLKQQTDVTDVENLGGLGLDISAL